MTAQITAALIAVTLASAIFYLVRRDHLHGPFAIWWLGIAVATVVLGVFPAVVVWLGRVTGISYAPVLPIIVGVSMILLRLLKMDMDRSRQERQLRRMTQKLAILEEEIDRLRSEEINRDKLNSGLEKEAN